MYSVVYLLFYELALVLVWSMRHIWNLGVANSRFFYASSACIYPEFKQLDTNVSLKESDAWPAEVFTV